MEKEKIERLKNILKDAEKKDPTTVRAEAKEFLKSVDAEELVQAEQSMMEEGITAVAVGHLCAAHLELMGDSFQNVKKSLPDGHPIQTLMLEHDEILKFIDELEKVNSQIQHAHKFLDVPAATFEALKHVTHHLVAAEKHHRREEEVLFPAAEAHGVYGPTHIMVQEHGVMRPIKHDLEKLANEVSPNNFDQFKSQLLTDGGRLAKILRDHIFKENYILYPTALDVIPNEEWVQIKEDADKIGYCCFTPKDNN